MLSAGSVVPACPGHWGLRGQGRGGDPEVLVAGIQGLPTLLLALPPAFSA